MLRHFKAEDRDLYLAMSDEFYHSDATDHPVPPETWARNFDEIVGGSSLVRGWMVVDKDGKPAGYMLASIIWSHEFGGRIGWLEELYIRSEFRAQGLGREALESVTEDLKNNDKVIGFRLEVAPANSRVAELYKRMGFRKVPYDQWWVPVEELQKLEKK